MNDLTTVILAKNEERLLTQALESVKHMGQVVVVDNHSTDKTAELARQSGAKVIATEEDSFAKKRDLGLSKVNTKWVFYLDADEQVTPELKQEIETVIKKDLKAAYRVKRHNYFLGKRMYDDWVERLFHCEVIKGWQGKVHETPQVVGQINDLEASLIHQTHRDITSMLEKTNQWSEIEAELRLKAQHPPVKWWRLVRIAVTVWWEQLTGKKVWRYGREGWFEGYFQMVDKLIVYTKLWERQESQGRR